MFSCCLCVGGFDLVNGASTLPFCVPSLSQSLFFCCILVNSPPRHGPHALQRKGYCPILSALQTHSPLMVQDRARAGMQRPPTTERPSAAFSSYSRSDNRRLLGNTRRTIDGGARIGWASRYYAPMRLQTPPRRDSAARPAARSALRLPSHPSAPLRSSTAAARRHACMLLLLHHALAGSIGRGAFSEDWICWCAWTLLRCCCVVLLGEGGDVQVRQEGFDSFSDRCCSP